MVVLEYNEGLDIYLKLESFKPTPVHTSDWTLLYQICDSINVPKRLNPLSLTTLHM